MARGGRGVLWALTFVASLLVIGDCAAASPSTSPAGSSPSSLAPPGVEKYQFTVYNDSQCTESTSNYVYKDGEVGSCRLSAYFGYYMVTLDKNHATLKLLCTNISCSDCKFVQRKINGECIPGSQMTIPGSVAFTWSFDGFTLFDFDFPIWAAIVAGVGVTLLAIAGIVVCIIKCRKKKRGVKNRVKKALTNDESSKPLLSPTDYMDPETMPEVDEDSDDSSSEARPKQTEDEIEPEPEEEEIEPPAEVVVELGLQDELAIVEAMIRNKKLEEALERYTKVLDKYGYQHGSNGVKEVAIHLADAFFDISDRYHADILGKLLLRFDKNSLLGRSFVQKAKLGEGLVSNLTLTNEVRDRKFVQDYAFRKPDEEQK